MERFRSNTSDGRFSMEASKVSNEKYSLASFFSWKRLEASAHRKFAKSLKIKSENAAHPLNRLHVYGLLMDRSVSARN